ncbi:unnamed protein product [Mytilus coruscus]|uniref:Farnesoic acid O-methyl transferase domain-containing protein n=1 Tax=Mytilus coruscus TaxID=42192 RepID=A0A6J8CK32_MYTCO|nr:unnamed protein product [Mytilus coruscus]
MDQWFETLFVCLLVSKASGIQIEANALTKVNGSVFVEFTPNMMTKTIDINRYNLELGGTTSLVFEVKACRNGHVLLSNYGVQNSSKPLYDILLGHNFDRSFIAYRADDSSDQASGHYSEFNTPKILNCNVFLPFWISWAGEFIKFGKGFTVGENTVGNYVHINHFEVRKIGVLTSHGQLGEWKVQLEVSDKFAGYFDSCYMNDTKADMVVVNDMQCSEIRCATLCGLLKSCMGYNFNSSMNRCELLSFGSDVVTDIPNHSEGGWRFYSKCYNGKTACLGCYF